MSNKVFNNLDTFYTKSEYDSTTGVLRVSNDDGTNEVFFNVVPLTDYSDITNKPEVYVSNVPPDSILREDDVYINELTGQVWSGTGSINMLIRDADTGGLVLDPFVSNAVDYTGRIVRAKDGNLYKQIVDTPTINPTDVSPVSTPNLDVGSVGFDRVSFESLTINKIFYYDRDTIGIIDEVTSTTYLYKEADLMLSILSLNGTRLPINGQQLSIVDNVLSISNTSYTRVLRTNSTVKPYDDSIIVLDDTHLTVIEPAGEVISVKYIEALLDPIRADIDMTKFMYIDGLLCFISETVNRIYTVDLTEDTVSQIDTVIESLAGKEAVLLDNGNIYYIADSQHVYGFKVFNVEWMKVGIDDILPNKFCNSLKLTDTIIVSSAILQNITNANGSNIVENITSYNGNIYLVEAGSSSEVIRVAGINTISTGSRVTSSSLSNSIVGLAANKTHVIVATSNNSITTMDYHTLVVDTVYDMTSLVTGDIISISAIEESLYVLTNGNMIYVFNDLTSSPVAIYPIAITGGLSKLCVLNSTSIIITDITGSSTGVYKLNIGKSGDVQLSTRIVVKKTDYTNVFLYLGKLAIMNKTINTDITMHDTYTELRRV